MERARRAYNIAANGFNQAMRVQGSGWSLQSGPWQMDVRFWVRCRQVNRSAGRRDAERPWRGITHASIAQLHHCLHGTGASACGYCGLELLPALPTPSSPLLLLVHKREHHERQQHLAEPRDEQRAKHSAEVYSQPARGLRQQRQQWRAGMGERGTLCYTGALLPS